MACFGEDASLVRWSGCGSVGSRVARWVFFGIFAASAALTWACREYGAAFSSLECMHECKRASSENGEDAAVKCFAKEAVLRISFATFLLYAGHFLLISALLTLNRDTVRPAQVAQAGMHPHACAPSARLPL